MISKVQFVTAVVAALVACPLAGAQARNGAGAVSPAAPRVQVASRTAPRSRNAGSTRTQSSQTAAATRGSQGQHASFLNSPRPDRFSNAPISDTPGFAALGGLAGNSFSHFGHHDRPGTGFVVPILFGAPYYYDDSGADPQEQQAGQPSQADGSDSADASNQARPADSGGDAGNAAALVAESRPPDPVPDIGNFILVRRDGSTLLASAFSVIGTELRYVTPEGIRHSLAMSDLDAGATERVNEARGTTLQFHD